MAGWSSCCEIMSCESNGNETNSDTEVDVNLHGECLH